jgi:SAM-dependent methyltransferase
MAKIAAQNTGLNVMVETFENINLPRSYFDGIWCMSSLLHVHRNNMLFVFEKLYDALVPGGYFYCTFKLRDNDFSDGKRHFTCYTELSFKELIRKTKFKIDYISEFDDLRPNRSDEKWLCVLLRKR